MSIPKPTGPFKVGCTDLMTTAKTVPSDLQPSWLCAQYTDLGVFVRLYYPCEIEKESESDYKLAPWIPTPHTKWYCNGISLNNMKTSWLSFIVDYTQRGITQNAFVDAPLISTSKWRSQASENVIKTGSFPLVVFSHGLSACRTFYSVFCTQLASEGFLVASIEHRDGSACSSFFIDGSGQHVEVPYYYKDITDDGDEMKFLLRNMQLLKRSKEIGKLLDLLIELNENPKDLENKLETRFDLTTFQDRIDVTEPMVFGQSFGAATALNVLHRDQRFKCGVVMDLWTVPLGPDLYCKMAESRSCLFIMTECWTWKKNVDRLKMYQEYQDKDYMETVTLRKAGHLDQTDSTPIIPRVLSWIFSKDLGPIDYEAGIRAQRDLVMSYFCKYLTEKALPIKLLDEDFKMDECFEMGYNWSQ